MSREVLLVNHVAVHRDQDIEAAFYRFPQQHPVLDSCPAEQGDGFDLMARQVAFQPPVEIFVQENAHSGKRQRMGLGLFQEGNNLLALDAGEAVEKIFDGVTGLQMVKQALYRHAGSLEDRLSPENLQVLHDDFTHGDNLIDKWAVGELNLSPPLTPFSWASNASRLTAWHRDQAVPVPFLCIRRAAFHSVLIFIFNGIGPEK